MKMGQTQKAPPHVSQQLKPVQSEIGRASRFVCSFDGAQPMKVTWFRDGVEIKPSFGFQVTDFLLSALLKTLCKILYFSSWLNKIYDVEKRFLMFVSTAPDLGIVSFQIGYNWYVDVQCYFTSFNKAVKKGPSLMAADSNKCRYISDYHNAYGLDFGHWEAETRRWRRVCVPNWECCWHSGISG